jgi:hypothetical protein
VLAEWMDRGGGVFAVGDHFNLGASMCSRIPRVRTMRKWTEAQGVPSQFGDDRNETLQLVPASSDDAREGDATPQTIEPVFRAGDLDPGSPTSTASVALRGGRRDHQRVSRSHA